MQEATLPFKSYGYQGGTSMAAAYVSATAALNLAAVTDVNSDGRVNDEVVASFSLFSRGFGKDGIVGEMSNLTGYEMAQTPGATEERASQMCTILQIAVSLTETLLAKTPLITWFLRQDARGTKLS